MKNFMKLKLNQAIAKNTETEKVPFFGEEFQPSQEAIMKLAKYDVARLKRFLVYKLAKKIGV